MPIANNSPIQVWIESLKVNGQWQFHDGSPMPIVCHIEMSGYPTEVHVRAYVQDCTNVYYNDAPDSDKYHYSCEYRP